MPGDVEARCTTCHAPLRVADSLRGGLVNCPRCGKLVEIPARAEWLYWGAVGTAGLVLAGISAWTWMSIGPAAGAIVALACAVALLLVVKAS